MLTSVKCGHDAKTTPKIVVNSEFNALEMPGLEQLKNSACDGTPFALADADELQIPNLKSAYCTGAGEFGVLEVCVVAQRRMTSDIDSWINYDICLETSPKRLKNDTGFLRRLLLGVHIEKWS